MLLRIVETDLLSMAVLNPYIGGFALQVTELSSTSFTLL